MTQAGQPAQTALDRALSEEARIQAIGRIVDSMPAEAAFRLLLSIGEDEGESQKILWHAGLALRELDVRGFGISQDDLRAITTAAEDAWAQFPSIAGLGLGYVGPLRLGMTISEAENILGAATRRPGASARRATYAFALSVGAFPMILMHATPNVVHGIDLLAGSSNSGNPNSAIHWSADLSSLLSPEAGVVDELRALGPVEVTVSEEITQLKCSQSEVEVLVEFHAEKIYSVIVSRPDRQDFA